jgi:hypothetical protein
MVVIISLLPIVAQQLLRSRDFIILFEERYTFSVNLFQTKKYISDMFIYLKEIDMTDMETIQVDSKTQ